MRVNVIRSGIAVIALFGVAAFATANAHPLSRQECNEGRDFITNAALARDNGMDGMNFMQRAIDDLSAIKAYPPHLRWFVQDERDEDFLLKAISRVFSEPADPQSHGRDFLAACLQRSAAVD